MNKGKLIYRLLAVFVAIISFSMGFEYATGAVMPIKDIILLKLDQSSRMTVVMDNKNPDIKVTFNRAKKEISLRVADTKVADIFKDLNYNDDLIESVSVTTGEKTDDTTISIKFKAENIRFFRTEPDGARGVTFDFRPVGKTIRIAGVTPEQILVRPSIAVARQTEPEPTAPEISPEEIEKRFAAIDEEYQGIDKMSGRKFYIQIMKILQNEEYADTAEMAGNFIKAFPRSIYLEKIYYSRADALYKIAKQDTARFQDAMDAYNIAMSTYPGSNMYDLGLMRRADLYIDKEFYVEALTEYGGLLRKSPKGKYAISAMIARADIHLMQKKFQTAYNELEKVLVLFPNKREVRDAKYLIGESFYDRGMFREANVIFDESIQSWPTFPKTHPEIYLKIMDARYQLGKYDEAMLDMLAMVNLFPDRREGRIAMLKLGELYTELDQKHKGASLFENLITKHPDRDEAVLARLRLASLGAENPDLLKGSGVFDYRAFENPMKTFDEVLARYGKNHGEEALRRKGKALAIQKRYIASILAFKELFRAYPGSRMSDAAFAQVRENFLRLINVYHEQKGFFLALLTYYNNFESFLKSVENPKILIRIADSFNKMNLHERAIGYYRLANNFDRNNRFTDETAFHIAKSTLDMGSADESKAMFQRFLKEFPASGKAIDARFALGSALFAKGKTAEAAAEWRIAMELNPRHPDAGKFAYFLANTYKKDQRYLLAIDTYNRAIARFKKSRLKGSEPFVKNSYYQITEAYYLDEGYPEAIRAAKRFTRLYPGDKAAPWMNYIVSASLSRIEMEDKAIERFKVLADKNKKSFIGRVAAARLGAFEWKKKNPDLFPD